MKFFNTSLLIFTLVLIFAVSCENGTTIPDVTQNLVENGSFEDEGSGGSSDASSWDEGWGGRTNQESYLGNWSLAVTGTMTSAEQTIATQTLSGLNTVSHIVSFWLKGNNAGMPISVQLNGSSKKEIVSAGILTDTWTRFNVDLTPNNSSGDLSLTFADNGGITNFYIDGIMIEEGSGSPSVYSE